MGLGFSFLAFLFEQSCWRCQKREKVTPSSIEGEPDLDDEISVGKSKPETMFE